jgi:hypothetical protein
LEYESHVPTRISRFKTTGCDWMMLRVEVSFDSQSLAAGAVAEKAVTLRMTACKFRSAFTAEWYINECFFKCMIVTLLSTHASESHERTSDGGAAFALVPA